MDPRTDVLSPAFAHGFVTHQARKLTLWWPHVPGATSYSVYRGMLAHQEEAAPVVTNLAGTTYTDSALKDGTTYFYQVTASNAVGESPRSVEASGETKAPPKVSATFAEPCPWIGDSIIRTSAWLRVDASSEDSALAYVWKSSGTAAPKAIINGKSRIESPWVNETEADFSRAGVYEFTVTVTDSDDLSSEASLKVPVHPVVTSITVMPQSVDLHFTQSTKFTAKASDQFGKPITPPLKLVWSARDDSVNLDPETGAVTAPRSRPGPPYEVSVTATDPATKISGGASLTIRDRGPWLVKPATIMQCPPNDPPLTTQTDIAPDALKELARARAQTVRLSARAKHDSGDSALYYRWAIVKAPEGANQNLAADDATALYWLTKDGDYTFGVTVTDQNGQSVSSTVGAVVRNGILVAPMGEAKPLQQAIVEPKALPAARARKGLSAAHTRKASPRAKARRVHKNHW